MSRVKLDINSKIGTLNAFITSNSGNNQESAQNNLNKLLSKTFDYCYFMTSYRISVGDQQFTIDLESLTKADIHSTDTSTFHLIQDAASVKAKVEVFDPKTKELLVEVNGNRYQVKIEGKHDLLVEKMGLHAQEGLTSKHIYAPMPGLILDVIQEAGNEIKKGDGLIILEAMKMENMLKAPGDTVVNEVKVKKGDTVEKGQLLMVLT